MSTAIANTPKAAAVVPHVEIFRRFAWKEFCMLREMWLAVFLTGAMVQWIVKTFTPVSDQAMTLFVLALGATVLYAIGAASTIFSVEHEERTYDFLIGLPATWWPLFAGKLVIVLASAVVLAACLSISGWTFCGFDTPGGNDARAALGLLGVAVLEGIAWGMLFSLVVKRPLVAAMLTVVVGAVTVNILVSISSNYAVAGANPDAYVEAVPLRLLMTFLVLLVGGVTARRWLLTGTAPWGGRGVTTWWNRLRTRAAAKLHSAGISTDLSARRMLLARLVWQTWRDAGKMLLVPLGVAVLLMLGMSAATVVTNVRQIPEFTPAVLVCAFFFIPALYGAMAFSADQRGARYRFLAEHAATPRFVWLARHIVWLGALTVVAAALFLLALTLSAIALRLNAANTLGNFLRWGTQAPEMDFHFIDATRIAVQGTSLAAIGMLVAYSIGQLSSMLVRSEILAAFFALVLSVLLSAWIAMVFAWQLSGWLFVLPLAAGLMLATWLRAPDWIAGRTTWRSWIKPALAVVAAVSLVGGMLPSARLDQIRNRPISMTHPQPRPTSITQLVPSRSPLDSPQSRETADMYRQAAALMYSSRQNNFKLLDRWFQPEYMEDGMGALGGIDEAKIPPDQLHQYRETLLSYEKLTRDADAAVVKLLIEASSQPLCYFEFDVRQVAHVSPQRQAPSDLTLTSAAPYQELNELLAMLWSADPAEPFDRLLAALRMSAHLAAGQPTVIWSDQLQQEQKILQKVGQWAAHDSRTPEELESALAQLAEHFRLWGSLQESLAADHRLVRNVLTGEEPPLVLAQEPASLRVQLAARLNELPWERQRSLEALDDITRQNIVDADELARFTVQTNPIELGNMSIRRWLRPGVYYPTASWPANWVLACPAATTSFLTAFEYAARTPVHELYHAYCDGEVCRRVALVQIALAMYRLDHGEYPIWLSELIPTYLQPLPLDPYSRQPFQYEARGLDLPLVRWTAFSNFQQINANTPLLWSVGPGNARLKREYVSRRVPNPADPTGDVREVVNEPVYTLATEEQIWWNEPALAFPLSSPSSAETDADKGGQATE